MSGEREPGLTQVCWELMVYVSGGATPPREPQAEVPLDICLPDTRDLSNKGGGAGLMSKAWLILGTILRHTDPRPLALFSF